MTYQEIVTEIDRLTMDEQVALLEHLQRSIQTKAPVASQQPRGSIEHLRGILATDGSPPTDKEIEAILVDTLLKKYS